MIYFSFLVWSSFVKGKQKKKYLYSMTLRVRI